MSEPMTQLQLETKAKGFDDLTSDQLAVAISYLRRTMTALADMADRIKDEPGRYFEPHETIGKLLRTLATKSDEEIAFVLKVECCLPRITGPDKP